MQHFPNPVTNERIMIWAVLGLEEEECVFIIYFIIVLPYKGMTVNGAWQFE